MTGAKIEVDKQSAAAILLTFSYLILFAIAGGKQAFLGVLVYLVLPWALITNAEALGDFDHGSPGLKYMSINRSTPRIGVLAVGWIFMVAPAIYFVLVMV